MSMKKPLARLSLRISNSVELQLEAAIPENIQSHRIEIIRLLGTPPSPNQSPPQTK